VTALDTNVLVYLLAGSQAASQRAQRLLARAIKTGPLVISPIVHAELGAHPGSTVEGRDRFLAELRIATDWALSEEIWRYAGLKYGEYAARRRKSSGSEPRRLIADFVIGAHAAKAGHLATLDFNFYRKAFPEVTLAEVDSA
jgi:predicted nucleic acid-binding protein